MVKRSELESKQLLTNIRRSTFSVPSCCDDKACYQAPTNNLDDISLDNGCWTSFTIYCIKRNNKKKQEAENEESQVDERVADSPILSIDDSEEKEDLGSQMSLTDFILDLVFGFIFSDILFE
ncbi:32840_t:CDS:2 [Racocetra persica]|uniref:32840_t:CDS:1 n=1 Tax=Racocetra persica TaxID=160502 RepID=A0ACA9MSS5_9GLOM|nr:32840_t:CDS:2 [Racocetra persica]